MTARNTSTAYSNIHNTNSSISTVDDHKYENEPTNAEESPFKIFIGIDFGTDGCGLAYALKSKNEVYLHNMWKDVAPTQKTRTSVLMDLDNTIHNHGSDAITTFTSSRNPEHFLLFEKFKMSLYDDPNWRSQVIPTNVNVNKVDIKDRIKPRFHKNNTNSERDSSLVFVAQLSYLREQALDFLVKKFKLGKRLKVSDDEIQWILTVPAIWSNGAKARMVEWAMLAGLINGETPNQLKIVYEPDCASLSIQYALLTSSANRPKNSIESEEDNNNTNNHNNKNNNNSNTAVVSTPSTSNIMPHKPRINIDCEFCVGDKYILLDIGGGTCDVACHQIRGKFAIEEMLHPSGGPWGGAQIDLEFENLLCDIFTEASVSAFKNGKNNLSMYQQLLNNFVENSKSTFFDVQRKKTEISYHAIVLPRNFSTFMVEQFEEMYVNNIDADYDYENGVEISNQYLRQQSLHLYDNENWIWFNQDLYTISLCLSEEIWKNMFNVVADPIIDHCQQILQSAEMSDTKYIFLVGGLANSKFIQHRISQAFPGVQCVVPHLPQLCVADGAARHGISPNFMKVRRLPKSYGIAANKKKETLNLTLFPKEFLQENAYFCKTRKQHRVANCFYAFALKSRAIRCDEKPIVRSFSKHANEQRKCEVVIFESDSENPVSTHKSEAKEIAKFMVEFEENSNASKVMVEFSYSDTMMKVYAYPEGEFNHKREIQIKYT